MITATLDAFAAATYLGDKQYDINWSTPSRVNITIDGDQAELEAFAALFPKSTGVKVRRYGDIHIVIQLLENDVNGGRNETGIKRVRRIIETLTAQGITVEMPKILAVNTYPTVDSFLAAL